MIKYGGSMLLEQIQVLFNKILNEMDEPMESKHSVTIPIYKKDRYKKLQRNQPLKHNVKIPDEDI